MRSAGEPSGSWALDLPAEEVPAELPEPCLGINFARDGMAKKEWLALVAVHSDAWLMSVAFYYGAKLNADQRCALATHGEDECGQLHIQTSRVVIISAAGFLVTSFLNSSTNHDSLAKTSQSARLRAQ